jgi:signal transduction histidine kinase
VGGISVRIDVSNIKVLADPMLEKVFYNLVDNSIRHGGGVKNIRISSDDSSNDLRIVYEDDGTGIKVEDKERIFERGFGKNTGLGLYLCREILALTGASIRENGKYKSGARFEIVVPSRNWTRD